MDGQTDGQTDRQTEFSSLDLVCILQRGKHRYLSVTNGYVEFKLSENYLRTDRGPPCLLEGEIPIYSYVQWLSMVLMHQPIQT